MKIHEGRFACLALVFGALLGLIHFLIGRLLMWQTSSTAYSVSGGVLFGGGLLGLRILVARQLARGRWGWMGLPMLRDDSMPTNKMRHKLPWVSVNDCAAEDGTPRYGIKIQTDNAELNVLIKPEEMGLFSEIHLAAWDDRRSIRIGECLGSPVFWCFASKNVTVLIGDDDEVWDIAFTLPQSILQDIEQEFRNL